MKRGFTLMEVLIVMAILVFVVAAAGPSLNRWAAKRQVQETAKDVRTKLFKARLGAMRSSHTYAFQYQTGSGSYRLSPQDQLASRDDGSAKPSGSQESPADDEDGPPPEEGALPEGMRFMADDRPDADATDENAKNVAQSRSGSGWSDPVFFYPDGTTSDARFLVANGRGYAVRIKLRGVTGNVVMGSAMPVTE